MIQQLRTKVILIYAAYYVLHPFATYMMLPVPNYTVSLHCNSFCSLQILCFYQCHVQSQLTSLIIAKLCQTVIEMEPIKRNQYGWHFIRAMQNLVQSNVSIFVFLCHRCRHCCCNEAFSSCLHSVKLFACIVVNLLYLCCSTHNPSNGKKGCLQFNLSAQSKGV